MAWAALVLSAANAWCGMLSNPVPPAPLPFAAAAAAPAAPPALTWGAPEPVPFPELPVSLEAPLAEEGSEPRPLAAEVFSGSSGSEDSQSASEDDASGGKASAALGDLFDGGRAKKENAPAAQERTRDFLQAYRDAEAGPSAEARAHRFLFVPGFMWDWIPGLHRPNLRAFEAMGLDARLVKVDSVGTMARNAEIVAAAIAASPKPVIVIAHSKGGLDALAALQRFPELRSKVAGFVAIQTPYFGSPAAELLSGLPRLSVALQAGARLLRARLSGLFDDAVAELAEGTTRPSVPDLPRLVSVVSSAEGAGRLHPLRLTRWAILRYKGKNSDGIVSPEDAVLPGSHAVRFRGLNHGDMIMDPAPLAKERTLGRLTRRPFHPERFTRALVHYLFPAGGGR